MKKAFYTAGAACLVWGQWALLNGRPAQGLAASAAGLLLLAAAAGVFEPLVQALARARQARRQAPAPARRGDRAVSRASAPAEPAAEPLALRLRALLLAERDLLPWDDLELPAWTLAIPGAFFLLLSQLTLLKGKIVFTILLMAAAGLFGVLYWQARRAPILIPRINANLRALLAQLPGLLLQGVGAVMLAQYRHVLGGYALVLAGGAASLLALRLRPFDLAGSPAAQGDLDLSYQLREHQSLTDHWGLKALLLGGAGVAWMVARSFAVSQPSLGVTLGFLSILLLLASFPWWNGSLADLDRLPLRLRHGLALAAAFGAVWLGFSGQDLLDHGALHPGLWRLLFAAIILVLALETPGRSRPGGAMGAGRGDRWAMRLEVLGVLALFLLALQARAWHVGIFPFGAEGDEAGGGYWAIDAMKGRVENPLVSANVPLPMFQLWALIFRIWGISLGTLRAISVFFGVLSVLSAYFFFRYFWGRSVAFLTALLMSFSYWHLHYSRFGHTLIQQVFFQMVAFYFAWLGFRKGRFRDFAIGGAAFGFAMLPHLASRLLPFEALLLLLYFLLGRRDILRARITGLVVFVLAAWMATAPSLVYWIRVIPLSMGRAQSVSIFDKTNTNAPADTLAGFVSNSKVSALMFNLSGDTRTRNNPLAPQKILESATAVLFALGLLFALYHWRDPLHFFTLSCFFINLSASIFSVEAPQTLRTAGNISVVFIFIGVLGHAFQRSFEGALGRWGRAAFLLLLLPVVSWFSWRSAAKYFVERKDLAFDLIPTLMAERAGDYSGKPYDAVFAATGFAASHPPVMLFAEDTPIRNYYDASEFLPLTTGEGRGTLVALCDDYQRFEPWVRSLYPEALVDAPADPRGGPSLVTFIDVPADVLAKNRGLTARSGGVELGPQPLSWPLKGAAPAAGAEWSGSLMVEQYGTYRFEPKCAGDFRLLVDGREAASSRGGRVNVAELDLAMGLHSVKASFRPASAADSLAVAQSGRIIRAGRIFGLRSGFNRFLGPNWLFPRQPSGFYGIYYASMEWKGEVQAETVEPGVLVHFLDSPILGGWSASWKARLRVEQDGVYQFRPVTGAFAELLVDGKAVARVGAPPIPVLNPSPVTPAPLLRRGDHTVELRFATRGYPWIDLYWSPPGRPESLMQGPEITPLAPGARP